MLCDALCYLLLFVCDCLLFCFLISVCKLAFEFGFDFCGSVF